MKNKILSLLMSLIMLMQMFVITAQAAEEQTFKKEDMRLGLLTELELVNPEKLPGEERAITRGEFADLAVKLFNGKMTAGSEVLYWDVPADYEYRPAVNILTTLGCIDGNDDGSFNPNGPTTVGAAVKIIVCMLGYADYSEVIGGYHNGYMELARMIELIPKNFPGAENVLDTDSFITLFYNALNAPIAEIAGLRIDDWGNFDVEYSNENRNTMLEEYWNIKYVEGIVEANAYTNLVWGGDKAYNSIRIDGRNYPCDKKYNEYLGYRLCCFYEQEGVDGPISVKYAYPSQKTTVTKVSVEDEVAIDGNTITYYEGSVKKRERFNSSELSVLKNGRPISFVSQFNNSLFNFADGNVVMIDNDDDGEIEVIKVTSYTSMVIKSTNIDDKKIYNATPNSTPVVFDEDDYYEITDTLGNEFEFEDLKADQVISLAISDDQTVYDVIVSYDYVDGKLSSVANDGFYSILKVDGEEYKAITGLLDTTLKASKEYTFYINASGYVVAVKEGKAGDLEFGYLIKVIEDTMDETAHIRLINKDRDVITIPVVDKAKVDGKTVKRANFKAYFDTNLPVAPGELYIKEIVRYALNEDGSLKEIDTCIYDAAAESEDTLRARYEGIGLRYKTGTTIKRFYIRYNAIPSSGVLPQQASGFLAQDLDNYFEVREPDVATGATDIDPDKVKVNSSITLAINTNHTTKVYSINNNTPIVCGMIVKASGTLVPVLGEGLYVVAGKTVGLTPDDDVRECITLTNGSETVELFKSEEYYVDPAVGSLDRTPAQLNIGDIVRYSTDFDGYIDRASLVYDYNAKQIMTHTKFLETVTGRISGGMVYDVNDIYIRFFSTYKDRAGNTDQRVTPQNAATAIADTMYWLKADATNYANGQPATIHKDPAKITEADAVDWMGEVIFATSINGYEVVRDEVVFKTYTTDDIVTYLNAGTDCSTIITVTDYGNLPAESIMLIK